MSKAIIICPARTHIDHRTHQAVTVSKVPLLPMYGYSDLPRIRSVLIERALQLGAERVIFIDADVVPTAEQLAWMAETDELTPKRAIWGIYPLRSRTTFSVKPKVNETKRNDVKMDESFEIEFGGLGLAVVHSASLRRVRAKLPIVKGDGDMEWRPYCMPMVVKNAWMADDRSLCHRLQTTGTQLRAYGRLMAHHVFDAEFATPDR